MVKTLTYNIKISISKNLSNLLYIISKKPKNKFFLIILQLFNVINYKLDDNHRYRLIK